MTTLLLEHAARELASAAAIARTCGGDNPFDPWYSLYGTIELVAAGLHPLPTPTAALGRVASEHLHAAAQLLDQVRSAEGPADLPFWKAHVADLHANASALEATTYAGGRSRP